MCSGECISLGLAFKLDRGNIYLGGIIYHCDSQWFSDVCSGGTYIPRDIILYACIQV